MKIPIGNYCGYSTTIGEKCGYLTTPGKYAWILSFYWGIRGYSGIEPTLDIYNFPQINYKIDLLIFLFCKNYNHVRQFNKNAGHPESVNYEKREFLAD